MKQFTLYVHGDNSSYSRVQCPICIAATLTGKALQLDDALYYMNMNIPAEITIDNYSKDTLAKDFEKLYTVFNEIEEFYPCLPGDLVSECKSITKYLYDVLCELLNYDITGVAVNQYIHIPEGARRNQLKYFVDKMRVTKLGNMCNKFKKYIAPFMSAYMFGNGEVIIYDKCMEYKIKESDIGVRVNIKFN